MALSLGELVAAARQADDQATVTDRIQNGHNQASGALGSILGTLTSMYSGGMVGNNPLMGGQGVQAGTQQML